MRYLILIGMLICSTSLCAQLLFPESYVVIFDSARHFKGAVSPSIEVKTPDELYIELNNRADIAYRFKNHGVTLANKFEFTKNGDETILSGGFVYVKFKTFYDNPFILEYYTQYQWAEARGMEKKYAAGFNLRYKIYKSNNGGAFIGIGPFVEHEEWNFQAVPESRLPEITQLTTADYLKFNFYASMKQTVSDKIQVEAAFYIQNTFNNPLTSPRIGVSSGISFAITPKVSLGLQYRMLHDYNPIVPVDKLWYNAFTQLEVTF